MEFTVSKSDLVRELNLSQGVVEKKTTIPILSNVLVEADGDRINLTATDLELGIRCSCPARVKKQGAGTIPAKRLLDYVRLLPDADLDVKLQENQWASLVCGRSRDPDCRYVARELSGTAADARPCWRRFRSKLLASMIAKTIFAISTEESRFTLNGALLILKRQRHHDGGNRRPPAGHGGARHGASRTDHTLPGVVAAQGHGRDPQAGRRTATDDAKMQFSGDENHLFFQHWRTAAAEPQADRQFPGFRARAAEGSPAMQSRSNRDEFRGAIERVAQFSDERSRAIRLRVLPGELKIHSSLSETGESEESMPIRVRRQHGRDRVQRAAICSISCERFRRRKVAFHFRDAQSAGELRPGASRAETETYNYRYVVMPMRI